MRRISQFFSGTIRRRLTWGFIVMLALVMITGLVGGIGVVTIQRALQQNFNAGFVLNDLAQQAIIDMRAAQRQEALYLQNLEVLGLETARNTHIDAIVERVDSFVEQVEAIDSVDLPLEEVDIAQLVEQAEQYRTYILQIADIIEARGALLMQTRSSQGGLQIVASDTSVLADVQATFAVLLAAGEQTGDLELINLLLRIQPRESVFLATAELGVYIEVSAVLDAFKAGFQEVDPAAYRTQDIEALVDDYLDGLLAYRNLHNQFTQITSYTLAIVARINFQLGDLQRIADEQVAQAEAAINTHVELVLQVMIVVVGVAFFLEAGLATGIQRSIAQPLRRILQTVRQIAGGDLDRRVAIRGTDEISALGGDINMMTDSLQALIETEQTVRQQLETTIAGYVAFVQQVAEGDLTSRLNLVDDQAAQRDLQLLGDNLNYMVGSLSAMTSRVHEAALAVTTVVHELLASATQQAANVVQQNTSVSQTLTSVEEIRSLVVQTADRSQMVAQVAGQSLAASQTGQQAIAESVSGMAELKTRVADIATAILNLSERTQQIGEIITTVSDIAEQSKLLALNASIEAARAGEEGRGFAVVAMEVRQLAGQSQGSTARISEILREIQQTTNTAVMVTEEGTKGALEGMALAERAGTTIQDLALAAEEAAQAAHQIAASTGQQINGMDQLTMAMTAIKQASTEAAASAKQTEQSAHNLSETVRRMEEAVARYRV